MAMARCQTLGLKTLVHKAVGNVPEFEFHLEMQLNPTVCSFKFSKGVGCEKLQFTGTFKFLQWKWFLGLEYEEWSKVQHCAMKYLVCELAIEGLYSPVWQFTQEMKKLSMAGNPYNQM